MFKKSKNKNLSPPAAPTFEEIMSDLETFNVDVPIEHNNSTASKIPVGNTSPVSLESWWQMFEKFIVNLKSMEMMKSEVEGWKIKLESNKLEIETESKTLRNDIEDQQNFIKELVE